MFYQFATQYRPNILPTHPQSAQGRYAWQGEYGRRP